MSFNSLAPGRLKISFGSVIFKLNLSIDAKGITFEIALMWLLLDLTGHKSRLVQLMVSCRQATSQAVTWANIGPDLCRLKVSLGYTMNWVYG